jgi:hypothetical protein
MPLQIKDGLAVLACAREYEVSLLLEPAPATPFDVVLDSLVSLIATNTASAPAAIATEADSVARPSNGVRSHQGTAPPPISKGRLRSQLESLGFTDGTFEGEQLRWRWRLINIALRAGSKHGNTMTQAQLHYLRAEIDFRMLHVRLAAMVRHCLHALRRALPEQHAAGLESDVVGTVAAGMMANSTLGVATPALSGGPAHSKMCGGSSTTGSAAGIAKQVRQFSAFGCAVSPSRPWCTTATWAAK